MCFNLVQLIVFPLIIHSSSALTQQVLAEMKKGKERKRRSHANMLLQNGSGAVCYNV